MDYDNWLQSSYQASYDASDMMEAFEKWVSSQFDELNAYWGDETLYTDGDEIFYFTDIDFEGGEEGDGWLYTKNVLEEYQLVKVILDLGCI